MIVQYLKIILNLLEYFFINFSNKRWKINLTIVGLYEGYAADVFPGLAQAIRDEDWNQAIEQAQIISSHIQQAALFLAGN